MRYLFFLVLLANISFFLWEWRSEVLKPAAQTVADETDYEHEILLVSEFKASQTVMSHPAQNSSEDDKKMHENKFSQSPNNLKQDLVCYDFGPFDDKADFLQWSEQNTLNAEDLSFYLKDVEVISGYLLFYPPADSLLKAQESFAILEAKGVENLWLFRFGDMKGAISFGFFNSEIEAKELQLSLQKMGVDSNIKKHSKVKAHTFAKIIWKNNEDVSQIIDSYKEKFPEQQVTPLAECLVSNPNREESVE